MKRKVWIGFAALCFLSGSRWLLEQAVPAPLPAPLRQALHSLVLVLVFGVAECVREHRLPRLPLRTAALVALDVTLLFSLPAVVLDRAEGKVASLTAALLFLLVPAVVALLAAQRSASFGVDARGDPRRLLTPALGGLFGGFLLFPLTIPSSTAGRFSFGAIVAAVVSSAYAAVSLHRRLAGQSLFTAAMVASAVIAAGEGLAGVLLPHAPVSLTVQQALVELGLTLAYDAPVLLLTLWLVPRMAPTRYAARSFLVVLCTLVESAILLRPSVGATTAAGMLLLLGASVWLLTASSAEDAGDALS